MGIYLNALVMNSRVNLTKPKLIRVCAACENEIIQENGRYPHLCDDCAEKQAHLELIRDRLHRLETDLKPFLWHGENHVRCPYCGSRAKLIGSSVKMIQCRFCGLFARRIDVSTHFKMWFMVDGKWEEFHYERDVTWGSVWEIFEEIDAKRKETESNLLDYQKRLKELGL